MPIQQPDINVLGRGRVRAANWPPPTPPGAPKPRTGPPIKAKVDDRDLIVVRRPH